MPIITSTERPYGVNPFLAGPPCAQRKENETEVPSHSGQQHRVRNRGAWYFELNYDTGFNMIMPRRRITVAVLSILITPTQAGLAQTEISAPQDKDAILRLIRFGNREINLPQRLANDELRLKNDNLRNDI